MFDRDSISTLFAAVVQFAQDLSKTNISKFFRLKIGFLVK
jgi:hypothetical protein